MKKIILTIAIVFLAGIVVVVNTNNNDKTISVKIAKVMAGEKNILATAD